MAKKLMLKDIPGFDEYLRRSYCDEMKTMAKIADEFCCTPSAIFLQLRRCGIKTRDPHDHETSERVREAWRKIGSSAKGRKLSEAQKEAISLRNTGRRARSDYEFGGHEKTRNDGYISVYYPQHQYANSEGYVMKHRLVMERALGITIPPNYVVHHINHNRQDNRVENLALMVFNAHAALHMIERKKEREQNEFK